jgi:hypothetical protein
VVELALYCSLLSFSRAFADAEPVVVSAKPTMQRSRRNAKKPTKTRWNSARRDLEVGTVEHMKSKARTHSVAGEGPT